MLRYRIYREHKFISAQISDLEQFIARINFADPNQRSILKKRLEGIIELVEGHADHEENMIHPLLIAKGSQVAKTIESEHKNHLLLLADLKYQLEEIEKIVDKENLIARGHQFYLAYRHFVAHNLNHINEEESIILPELQRLYSDQELKSSIDHKIYATMSSEEMVEMLLTLFPVMNSDDKEFFLRDLQEAEPNKFILVWQVIAGSLDENEKNEIKTKLNIL